MAVRSGMKRPTTRPTSIGTPCLMRLALYEPDIPQNTGTILRLAACLGVGVDVIEPCGFIWSDTRMKRAGMDYLDSVDLIRWKSFDHFLDGHRERGGRLVLLSAHGAVAHTAARYQPDDTLMLGRESAGVPDSVRALADLAVAIPMRPGFRSLNVAISGAIVLAEALRQTGNLPAFNTVEG